MRKTGVLLWVFLLLALSLLNIASAQHSAVVTLRPVSMLETQAVTFNLTINNFGSTHSINQINAQLGGFTVTGVTSYSDWQNNFTANSIFWHGGLIHNNVMNALFQFLATAPNVNANQTYTFTFTTKDTASAEQTHTLSFTIVNDDTGPVLSNQSLANGAAVRQGTSPIVSITAADDETGVSSVAFRYVACDDANATPTTALLSNSGSGSTGSTYSATVDLSSFANGKQVCFDYIATSKGDATTTSSGRITIDGTAPTVTLSSPSNSAFINGNANFSFSAVDNLAGSLSCSLLLDNTAANTTSAQQNVLTTFPASLSPDGQHSWNVECTDSVGLAGRGTARTYTLDKTQPRASLDSPANKSIISAGTPVKISVSDNYGVASVIIAANGNATQTTSNATLSTDNWPDGPTTILVDTTDTAGNAGTAIFSVTVDKSPPIITLNGPTGTSDVHVNFTFTATDTYDPTLTCDLVIDNSIKASKNITAGTESIAYTVYPSTFQWRIDCTDSANNRGSSQANTLTTADRSAPDIAIAAVDYVARGDPIDVSATITDPSPIASVVATVVDPNGTIATTVPSANGNVYTISYPTTTASQLGNYTVTFSATDSLGYGGSASEAVLLTYKYVITLDVSPSSASPLASMIGSGSVLDDLGRLAPESVISFSVDNSTALVALNQSGNFKHSFAAPSSPGTYNATASITSSDNGVTYTASALFTVSSGGSGGSSGSSGRSGGGIDLDAVAGNYQPPGQSGTTTSTGVIEDAQPVPADSSGAAGEPTPETDPANVRGIGAAAGFFTLDNLRQHKLLSSLLAFLALVGLLALASRTSFRDRMKRLKGPSASSARPKALNKAYQPRRSFSDDDLQQIFDQKEQRQAGNSDSQTRRWP